MGQHHTSNRIILDNFNLEKIVPIEVDLEEFLCDDHLDRNDPDVYNVKNQSPVERNLPYELVIHILKYLSGSEIIKMMRVSKNFARYWLFQPLLWKDKIEHQSKEPNCLLKPMRSNVLSALVNFHENLVPRVSGAVKSGQLVVGDQKQPRFGITGYKGCGKSTWLHRFVSKSQNFESNYVPTSSASILQFDYSDRYNLELIEIGGYEQFAPYRIDLLQRCNVLFFCFDVSSIDSFSMCKQMIRYFEKIKTDKNMYEYLLDKNRFIGLIGMKTDKERKVTNKMVIEYMEELIPEFYLHGGIDLVDCRVQYFELCNKSDSVEKLEFPFIYSLFVLRKFLPTQENRDQYW